MYTTKYLDIPPLAAIKGQIQLPGSKSISNRALLLAALCQEQTTLHGVLESDDTNVMIAALKQLGCEIDTAASKEQLKIKGITAQNITKTADIFLGNAGTAMRPLTAMLAIMGAGQYTMRGIERMHERPIGDLVEALNNIGCQITHQKNHGYPPLQINPANPQTQNPIQIKGNTSSQFLTALLMALPLASKEKDIQINVIGELISKPYIQITINLMAKFGVQVQNQNWQQFTIPANSQYKSPLTYHIEADASSASYWIAAAALSAPNPENKPFTIQGLSKNSIQGDIKFIEAIEQMGVQIQSDENSLHIYPAKQPLRAIELDCNHIPDAAMTLAVLALYARSPSTLKNIASWRVKETDRIEAMAKELKKLGAGIKTGHDYIKITPPQESEDWLPANIRTYDDHRMAMCASLAAFNPARQPVRIQDPKCVAKTYPNYFEDLFELAKPAQEIPIICIDGPTASGKGTLAKNLAKEIGYHILDSGALYRLVALATKNQNIKPTIENQEKIAQIAQTMQTKFIGEQITLENQDVTQEIRTEEISQIASIIAAMPNVRKALIEKQKQSAKLPGLVADGRDMGTKIFPQAQLKIFLTASAKARAERRYKQLQNLGISASIDTLCADLQARDERDQTRAAAPLEQAPNALPLDNSQLDIQTSTRQVLTWWQARQPFTA